MLEEHDHMGHARSGVMVKCGVGCGGGVVAAAKRDWPEFNDNCGGVARKCLQVFLPDNKVNND